MKARGTALVLMGSTVAQRMATFEMVEVLWQPQGTAGSCIDRMAAKPGWTSH